MIAGNETDRISRVCLLSRVKTNSVEGVSRVYIGSLKREETKEAKKQELRINETKRQENKENREKTKEQTMKKETKKQTIKEHKEK